MRAASGQAHASIRNEAEDISVIRLYKNHTKGFVMKLRLTGFEVCRRFVIRLCL